MRKAQGILACLAVLAAGVSAGYGSIRNTRTGYTYTTMQSAVNAAANGDTIEIDSDYSGSDVFASVTRSLTIRGVGPSRPILDGNFTCPNNHGILDINGGQTVTIENLDIRNCRGASGGNGCGIRLSYPQDVIVRNCYFYNNEDGIMGANGGTANITLESCEFDCNGWGDLGYTHNIYIGTCNTFMMRYCWSHNAHVGHEVKTRAATSYILYNRIGNETMNPDGRNASYEIDVPQGGLTYIIGNQVHQGPYTENSIIITYKEEAPTNADLHLYVVDNTIVNQRGSGTFIRNVSTVTAIVQNNILQGYGTAISGPATSLNNWITGTGSASLANLSACDYHLTAASTGAINLGGIPSPGTGVNGFSLIPVSQYVHPLSYQARPVRGTIDIGAYEYAPNAAPTVNAGADQAVVEGQAVALHAAASDPGGDLLQYAWTQPAGLPVVLDGAATADASLTAPVVDGLAQAAMTFTATVSDGLGGAANDSVNVRVYMLGDIDHNDAVDVVDLLTLVAAFGSGTGQASYDAACDFNNDGAVDVVDLLTFVDNFGRALQ